MAKLFFEDVPVGRRFGGQRYEVPRAEMLEFARKWDPRPIHLDDEAGRAAGFDDAIASGAYTVAIFALLGLRSREADGEHAVIAALGSEQKFLRRVRGADVLEYRGEIMDKRESKSRPDAGIVTTRAWLQNQEEEIAYEARTVTLFYKRPRP